MTPERRGSSRDGTGPDREEKGRKSMTIYLAVIAGLGLLAGRFGGPAGLIAASVLFFPLAALGLMLAGPDGAGIALMLTAGIVCFNAMVLLGLWCDPRRRGSLVPRVFE